jgi:RimJ/RimL family protein N-acetyltransferase
MADLRFEPLCARHLPAVADVVLDPAVRRFTRFPDPPAPGFPGHWVEAYESGRRDGTREAFAALAPDDGRFLGVGLAVDIDREAAEVELGYIVAPAARGRGVASAILRRMTDWCFAEAGALRIRLLIDTANAASLAVADRCGYVREGVLRCAYVKPGVRADTVMLSRLPSDPAPA